MYARAASLALFFVGGMFAGGLLVQRATAQPPMTLADAYGVVAMHRFVDLTHAFAPGIPHWRGFPNETVKTLFTYKPDGFLAQQFGHVGQWGTHVDAPAHFDPHGATVDRIPPSQMLLPLVVLERP